MEEHTMPQHIEDRAVEILAEMGQRARQKEWRIVLPFPPSSNTAYPSGKNGMRFLSKKAKEWRAEALPIIEDALRTMNTPERISMAFYLCFPNNRKCDIANYIKLPQDAVCEVLGIDDNHFVIPETIIRSLGVDKDIPHCTVIIKPIGGQNGNV